MCAISVDLICDIDENGGIIAPEEPANSMLNVIFFLQLLDNTVLSHSILLQMMCAYLAFRERLRSATANRVRKLDDSLRIYILHIKMCHRN